MKKISILLMVIASLTLVAGAWFFTINGGFSISVQSLPGYSSIDLDIPILSVNTTSGSDSDSGFTSFIINRDMTLNVSITETFQDDSGGECAGGLSDCEISYWLYNGTEDTLISDGMSVFIKAMPTSRNLTAEINCIAYSCPQSRNIQIRLTEVE